MFGCKLLLNLLVQLHTDAIPLGNPNRLVHNDSSSSQSSLGSITRSCLTKAEQNKCTARVVIQKGSVQCTEGGVCFRSLLCTTILTFTCSLSSKAF